MLPVKNFAVIEFPGLLRNPSDPRNAIAALGGENSVRNCTTVPFAESVPPLNLNLRDGLRVSPSSIVGEKSIATSNLFALKVTCVAEKTPNRASEQSEENSPAVHSVENNNKNARVIATLLGQVTSLTSFRSIADFQYHPRTPHSSAANHDRLASFPKGQPSFQYSSSSAAAGESLFLVAKKYGKRSRLEDPEAEIDRLRPARFVRGSTEYGNTDYWFRQFSVSSEPSELQNASARPSGRTLIEDRRSDARRLEILHHRVQVDAEDVPTQPHPSNKAPLFRGRESFDTLYAIITELFKVRPIWIRRALYEGVPDHLKKSFKRVIVQHGYCFQGPSPFYQAWIRYGYDPRKDPQARKYQVIEIRCSNPIIQEASARRREELESEEEGHRDAFKLPTMFTLCDVPLRQHNFVQLCDIRLPEVEEFCRNERAQHVFDRRCGYFSAEGFQKLNATIRSSLIRLSSETIGKERMDKLLKDYRKYKDSLRKKRKRTSLIDVMKRETSQGAPSSRGEDKRRQSSGKKPPLKVADPVKRSGTEISSTQAVCGEKLAPDRVADLPDDVVEETVDECASEEQGCIGGDSAIALEEIEELEGLQDVEGFQIIEDDDKSEQGSDDFDGEGEFGNEGGMYRGGADSDGMGDEGGDD